MDGAEVRLGHVPYYSIVSRASYWINREFFVFSRSKTKRVVDLHADLLCMADPLHQIR